MEDIDLSYLRAIASDSNEFMIEMIDLFLEQTPDYFNQLQQAVGEKNWKDVAALAHKIKPTLAFMGFNAAKEDIEVIEKKARALDNVEAIPELLDQLRADCFSLFAKLKDVRAQLAADV